jgi:pyridoxal phosphate enzyme (YggS family)
VNSRLEVIRRRIAKTCRSCGRSPDEVTLVAVSKMQPPEAVDAALAAGHRVFGENRVQEAQGRWREDPRSATPVELRLIGPLQTNKAVDALELFDLIETLDRPRLARALAAAGDKLGRTPRALIQVNTGSEPQKAGVEPDKLDDLVKEARRLGLRLEGLMCIPPVEEAAGPHFALLRKLARRHGFETLSMGMSGDYETAIRFGATHIRLGSALFGERNRLEGASRG